MITPGRLMVEVSAQFKAALKNTERLKSWTTSTDPCHAMGGAGGWHGVHCTTVEETMPAAVGEHGRVAPERVVRRHAVEVISLNHEDLEGHLAPELAGPPPSPSPSREPVSRQPTNQPTSQWA